MVPNHAKDYIILLKMNTFLIRREFLKASFLKDQRHTLPIKNMEVYYLPVF